MRLLTTLISSAFFFTVIIAQNDTLIVTTSAQLPSITSEPVVSGTQGLTPAQSSQAACLSACPATDPNCRAKCVTEVVPSGDYGRQNATIECISSCDHGNGTAAENLEYEGCLKDCVASATITPASTAAPTIAAAASPTGMGEAGSGGDESANSKSMQATETGSGGGATGTSSASASSTSKGAADNVRAGAPLTGMLGVLAAILAI